MLNRLSLNKLSLNRIDLNRIGGRDVGVSARPYIDPDLLKHIKMAIYTWGKSNDDPDRAVLKDLSGNGNDMRLLNFGFAGNSGYGLPGTDFEGWLCTDGVDDIIESVKPVSEMLEGSNEITVVSIIHYFDTTSTNTIVRTNFAGGLGSEGNRWKENRFDSTLKGKTGIYGWSSKDIGSSQTDVIKNILGDKNDYRVDTNTDNAALSSFSVVGLKRNDTVIAPFKVAYAGGFIANKALITDEINQIIAYYNLDRPGQIIKPQLYCNIKKQGITNDNHAEFNDQLIDFINGHNIQLNNIGWEGESGIIDGALYLDGINDFGKVTGLPVLKDYTVVADRKILGNNGGGTLSKSYSAGNGAFIFETGSVNYSFGTGTSGSGIQSKRMLSYLSKYIYNGNPVQAGASVDSDTMWIGTVRDGDTRFSNLALWSLMLFPYSLSEFLLERQLKKYKAGTLYPDMIEFRPIVKSNVPYSSISYSVNPGVYVTEGSAVTITITLENASDKLVGVSSNAISDISISGDNGVYEVTGKVTKSPQKINIVISSYLTMLNNDTLISNETLIKNE